MKDCWIIVDVISCLCGFELCNVMKMVISSLFVWTCHLHYYEALVVTSVMCIEKEWVLKRMYNFEGRIARRDGYYISRDVSHAAMDTIFWGTYRAPRWLLLSRVVSCAATDAWTDMSPMGPGLRDSGCVSLGQTCIIILDNALHILIIGELDIVFCWSCDWISAKFVIDEYWACYWGYIICWIVVVEGM